MNILELATTKHKEWIVMAKSLGCGNFSEDIVQEMYLRLHKYIDSVEKVMYGDEINKSFVYITLRNLVYDFNRAQKKSQELIDTNIDYETLEIADEPFDETIDELNSIVLEEMKDWYWYDRTLFEYVYKHGIGQREMARDSTISLSSIHNTIKNAKERIKAAAEEKRTEA